MPSGCQFLSEGLGNADHRPLRAAIGGKPGRTALAGDRCRIDDRRVVGCPETRHGGASHQKHPLDVDREDPVPLGFAEFLNGAAVDDAGIVEQNIQAAEGVDGGANRLFAGGRVGDVEGRALDFPERRQLGDRARHLGVRTERVTPIAARRQIGDHHPVARFEEALRHAFANAAGTAGHEYRSLRHFPSFNSQVRLFS